MNITEDAIQEWKLYHPLFKEKLSFDDFAKLKYGNLTDLEELQYLEKVLPDLSALMADVQVRCFDLLPHLMMHLIEARKNTIVSKVINHG